MMLAHCHLKILTRRGPSTKETSTPSSSNRFANLISKCAEKKERRQAPTSLRALGVRILFQLRKDEEVNQTTLREQNLRIARDKAPDEVGQTENQVLSISPIDQPLNRGLFHVKRQNLGPD